MSQPIKLVHWAFEVTGCRDCTRLNKVCQVHEVQRERVESETEKAREIYLRGYNNGQAAINAMHAMKPQKLKRANKQTESLF